MIPTLALNEAVPQIKEAKENGAVAVEGSR
jgi:hypothetical protein